MNEVSEKQEYRPRKAHKKSRNGCIRCKQRKTKCDEGTPRCSRCERRDVCCQYRPQEGMMVRFVDQSLPDGRRRQDHDQGYGISPTSLSPFSVSSSPFQILSPLLPSSSGIGILDSAELELLSHYLTHTSLTIPFDMDDLYALRVGIPNLAFRSKPLMSSILALAAVCTAHDLMAEQDRRRILDLLVLADRYHRASLLQVQIDLSDVGHYSYVLANTTLMVLYASASYSVRIRLVETQTLKEPLPREFMPVQSQWISLIRAAHLAFVGLLNGRSGTDIGKDIEPVPGHGEVLNETISPQDGPTTRTKYLLFPILSATSGPALEILRTKARTIWKAHQPNISSVDDTGLQACFATLEILASIMTEVFDAQPSSTCHKQSHSDLNSLSLGQLSAVSSWLRTYVARVTSSTTTPRPLRRVIMAFLNRVPAQYLSLVQTMLDSIGVPGQGHESWESSDVELLNPSPAHRLAIDIFAHWVVLVMLLDGVWWIGGIGSWELGRVISFVRARGWIEPEVDAGRWWPESMYNVAMELRNVAG